MVWSRNDSWMVTADQTGYVKYWQSNMNNVKMFQAHKEPVRAIRCATTTAINSPSHNLATFAREPSPVQLAVAFSFILNSTFTTKSVDLLAPTKRPLLPPHHQSKHICDAIELIMIKAIKGIDDYCKAQQTSLQNFTIRKALSKQIRLKR